MKILILSVSPLAIKSFLLGHIQKLSKNHEVVVVSNDIKSLEGLLPANVNSNEIKILRKPSIFKDLISLFKLVKLFNSYNPDLSISINPKAGLINAIAGTLSGVKFKVHWFTGQVWSTQKGLKRNLLIALDKLIFFLSDHCLVDSFSQQKFLIKNKVLNYKKSSVIGKGSVGGVDLKRFKRDPNLRKKFRKKLGIDDGEFIFLFLGRINKDKGVTDLIDVFNLIKNKYLNVKLLIVGDIEDKIFKNEKYDKDSQTLFFESTANPEKFINIANVLCLPSYREGFGSVIIEAAANGVPSLGSNIYGIQDAIKNNITGILHKVKSVKDIANKMSFLIENDKNTLEMGKEAYIRAYKDFDSISHSEMFNYFCEKL